MTASLSLYVGREKLQKLLHLHKEKHENSLQTQSGELLRRSPVEIEKTSNARRAKVSEEIFLHSLKSFDVKWL